MEGFPVLLLIIVAAPILWGVASMISTHDFKAKFANLGTLAGKTKGEILLTVGPPNSTSAMGEGKELLQWQRTGYHIALIFSDGVCEGVSHEYSA